jgi:glycosyltransferase involved in cell wall biosynthesis
MMRVLWKVSRLDLTWPSVRVRAMTPALLLRQKGIDVAVTAQRPTENELRNRNVVVISKSFSDDDLWLAARTKQLGKKLVIDLCDDVFGESRDAANAAAFNGQAAQADIVTTTGNVLRDIIAKQIGGDDRIVIVPDHAETLPLTRDLVAAFPSHGKERARVFGAGPLRKAWRRLTGRERALTPGRKTVVWFGMAGLPGEGTGVDALAAIAPQLNTVNNEIPLQLLIVTTAHGRTVRAAAAFDFPWAFRDWGLLSVHEHVASADVCVIPNPQTSYASAKSPNRALLALSAGTPVVATSSPAYALLNGAIMVDDWQGGLRRYLTDPTAAANDLAAASRTIEREFSAALICDRWANVLTQAAGGRAP